MRALNRIILGLLISVLWMHGRMHALDVSEVRAGCGCTASGHACHCDSCTCAAPSTPAPNDQTPPPSSRADWSTAPSHAAVALRDPAPFCTPEPTIAGPQSIGWQLARRPEPRLCVWRT